MSANPIVLRSSMTRGAMFLALWLMLIGPQLADLLVGLLAAGLATSASLHLLPPGQWKFHLRALAAFVLRFLHRSVAAGIDVAWRAFSPRLPLRPGFVTYRPRISRGPTLNAFCTVMSLVPGTLPAGLAEDGGLVIHCLDIDQPVAAQARDEEQLLASALGAWPDDD